MSYFLSPLVLYGRGMLKRFVQLLQGKGDKAMLITGKTTVKLSDQLVETLVNAGLQVKIWDGAEPEPSIDVALAGSKALLDFGPQLVIGFGGGSAIDTAKAAWILYERPDLGPSELNKSVNPKTKLHLRKRASFAAVPTTSGTGSEGTQEGPHGFAGVELVYGLKRFFKAFSKKIPKENLHSF